MLETVLLGVEAILGVAALTATIRLVRGPHLADRIIALDLILAVLAARIAVASARTGTQFLTPVLVGITLVAFVGTVLVARYIEARDVEER